MLAIAASPNETVDVAKQFAVEGSTSIDVPNGPFLPRFPMLPWSVRVDRGAVIRLLVALEDDYRTYRKTIAAALQSLRPDAEVESVAVEALEEELERFDPQLVICSGRKGVESGSRFAWIELSTDPTQPTKIRIGGPCLEQVNHTMEALPEVVDEFE